MKSINIHEAKTRLSAVLSELESSGQEVIICRNGKPVARLTPFATARRTSPDPFLSQIEIGYDPTEELENEDWPEELR